MAASRDYPFPLLIVCLLFVRGYSPLPTTSLETGTNPMRPMGPSGFLTEALVLSTEDYDQLEDPVTPIVPKVVSPHGGIPQRCNYNPCLENQVSCTLMAASTGCLCPGSTLHNRVPDAPDLKSVSWNGSEVVIQWCAPYSYVTAYVVKVGGQERQQFGNHQRSGAVGDIDHITEVCVFAENDSGTSDGSCMMYSPRDNSLPLKAGLIGGALGFLLLLLLAVLLWRHRRQRKQEASISMHDTAETQ
ncbi:leucine-rich repeat neuronal protein 4 [Toxotes jaculatrix]|uniref:leucine-rich repeat neuronal protein 4 n=1 Tax=Toxotes jaculatrix TaxID=941984 RepID=UPI001B3ACC9C|nr:leucine-rich repeat neuronal protein 4 [Toxotes jaculatrix]